MDYADKKVKLAAEVVQSFVDISKSLTKFSQQSAESLGLTLHQMGILNTIYSSPNTTLKNITEKLQFSKSTVSVCVDELVHLELVEKKINEEDRRGINIKLTTAGETLARKSCQNASSYKAMILVLDKISEEKINCLIHTNRELLTYLQSLPEYT
jgi:DNA-binding MarR family transcriptional regulator